MRLEWWDENDETWRLEQKKRTNKRGRVTLEISPLCDDGSFCVGEWEYQIHAPKRGRWAAMYSWDTDIITFVASTG